MAIKSYKNSETRDIAESIASKTNDQYRICFTWDGVDAENVEITDYH